MKETDEKNQNVKTTAWSYGWTRKQSWRNDVFTNFSSELLLYIISSFLHKRQIHKGLVIQQAFFQVCSLL